MCEEKVEVEVQGVLEIHRNYTTGLAVIYRTENGHKQYTGATRVFDERLYKKHLKRGYPEKTDAEIDALACAWFPECKGGKTDIPFLTYTDALNKMRDLVGEVKRREV